MHSFNSDLLLVVKGSKLVVVKAPWVPSPERCVPDVRASS